MASANSFFSLVFSPSSPFRRLASETSSPSVLGFPVVEARLADPVLPAQVGRLHAGLVLFQDGNDLLFRMPIALHRLVLSSGPDSSSPWISSRGQRHGEREIGSGYAFVALSFGGLPKRTERFDRVGVRALAITDRHCLQTMSTESWSM